MAISRCNAAAISPTVLLPFAHPCSASKGQLTKEPFRSFFKSTGVAAQSSLGIGRLQLQCACAASSLATPFLRLTYSNCHESSQRGSRFISASHGDIAILSRDGGERADSKRMRTDLQVVLVSPQIPGNTGCIARSCAAAGVGLHLVEPLGFEISSAKLKRAGLDYWPYPLDACFEVHYPDTHHNGHVVVKVHKSWTEFFTYFKQQRGAKRLLGFTKSGNTCHTVTQYRHGDWLLFGSETDGLPDAAIQECSSNNYGGGLVRIPIDETYVRCLNLSVAAGIGLYEALRQLGYPGELFKPPKQNSVAIVEQDVFS